MPDEADGEDAGASVRPTGGSFRGRPHLVAVLMIAAALAVALVVLELCVDRLETNYVHTLLASGKDVKALRSLALQRRAFEQPDLLPLYGSSELIKPVPNRAMDFFHTYPTGFNIFPVGKAGTYPLIMLQHFVGVGPEIRGRKVAISISAGWFRESEVIPDQYRGNFLLPTAREFLFSTHVNYALRRAVARRIATFQETYESDSVVTFAIRHLSSDSAFDRVAYWAAWPLGRLQILVSRWQDHFEIVVAALRLRMSPASIQRTPQELDWPKLIERAGGGGDPPGDAADPPILTARNRDADAEFLAMVRNSPAWGDLDLLLQSLEALGARPLLLCTPMNGRDLAGNGVSRAARDVFYRRMAEAVARSHVAFCQFADHDADRNFVYDRSDHLSGKGWMYYNRALDDFVHDRLKDESR